MSVAALSYIVKGIITYFFFALLGAMESLAACGVGVKSGAGSCSVPGEMVSSVLMGAPPERSLVGLE